MDIQLGGFIRIISRVCHVIGIGDIQTQIPPKTWTRHDKVLTGVSLVAVHETRARVCLAEQRGSGIRRV